MVNMCLIFFGLILITLHSSADPDEEKCGNPVKRMGFWESLFQSRSLADEYCTFMMLNSPRFMEQPCLRRMRAYFAVYSQIKSEVVYFARTCGEKMGDEDWDKCIDILLHFQDYPYCWTMTSLANVLYLFDKDKFLVGKKYERFTISAKEFVDYRRAGIDLKLCMDDLAESFDETKESLDKFMEILRLFMEESHKNPKICNCIMVLGIKKLLTNLQENMTLSGRSEHTMNFALQNGDGNSVEGESPLKVMYYDVCFNDDVLRNKAYYWTREKMKVLIYSSHYLDINKAIILLNYGTTLVAEGWYTPDRREKHWPLNYLLYTITNKEGEITNDNIQYIPELIAFGFSAQNYTDFIELLLKSKGFKSKQCERELMKLLLDVGDGITNWYYKSYFWKSKDKKQFHAHLELLIKMFID